MIEKIPSQIITATEGITQVWRTAFGRVKNHAQMIPDTNIKNHVWNCFFCVLFSIVYTLSKKFF